uniref:Endonuclease/exonuclease/phosphatase domain-containing protein n=1 Tax=Stegastes partitus TaxID=144197 RepID=A0A3B5B5F1_9TELE
MTMVQIQKVKIISLNVKGLGHVVKRQKIISFLKRANAQIALQQETQLTEVEHIKLRRGWIGQVFYSSFNSHSMGEAIFIQKKLPFNLEEIIDEGRFVIISGFLYGEGILIGSVYGPNTFEPSFFSHLTPFTVLGGDFKSVQDASIDQPPPKQAFTTKKTARLKELCADLGLFDVWRIRNPREKDYTFYSHPHPHQSLWRIDYFLVSTEVMDRVKACSIEIRTLSDHNPVSITVSPPYLDPSSRHWRLNPSLLSSPPFLDFLEKQWELFMSTNNTPGITPSLLWETAKAFIMGSIISFTAAHKRDTIRKQLELEHLIEDLENTFKSSPSKQNLKKLESARSALNQLLTSKAEASILFDRCYTPGKGNNEHKTRGGVISFTSSLVIYFLYRNNIPTIHHFINKLQNTKLRAKYYFTLADTVVQNTNTWTSRHISPT